MNSNYVKYNFSDFTTKNYINLIKIAKQNWNFRLFSDRLSDKKIVLWRHDIDFSPHRALKLAEIEHKEDVKSTYFILLHSEFYNLLETEVRNIIKNIINLGHSIGLHFDTHFYDIKSEVELRKYILFEKNLLEKIFNIKIKSFSFHITDEYTAQFEKKKYAGLINTYSSLFKTNYEYCSDSNGYWRYNRLEDTLRNSNNNRLQVLTHPELWQDVEMSPKARIWRCIDGRAAKTKAWYENILKVNNRLNIDY